MKIKLSKLKKIIRETIEGATHDVTQDAKAAARAWPRTTWRGHHVVDEIMPLEDELEVLLREQLDDFQEVYLGYVEDTDTFVAGWDVWIVNKNRYGDEETEFLSAVQEFRVFEDNDVPDHLTGEATLSIQPLGKLVLGETGFYSKHPKSGYSIVKNRFPSIVDLRLD